MPASPFTGKLRALYSKTTRKLLQGRSGLCSVASDMYGVMERYRPPEFAAALNYIPAKRIRLAVPNTPIHPWRIPGAPAEFSVSIKRDDLTGSPLSGNKVRKLEFLMADALDKGCGHVITCGGLQSNHCRAVAVCARQLGMTPHLILRTDDTEAGCEGNVLIDRLCGARTFLVPRKSPYLTHLLPRMEKLAQHLMTSEGGKSYLVPVGGSNRLGLWGYIMAFDELQQQGVIEDYDDLVFTCGSGGTAAGLSIANHLTGGHLRLHGICVSDNAAYFYDHIEETLREVGLGHLEARSLLSIIDGYKGRGYGLSTPQELDFIQRVAMESAILLDPVYSGKAALAMVTEMTHDPSQFKGRRVLFLHTGGIFGLFDGRMTAVLQEKEEQQHLITHWPEVNDAPF